MKIGDYIAIINLKLILKMKQCVTSFKEITELVKGLIKAGSRMPNFRKSNVDCLCNIVIVKYFLHEIVYKT